MLALANNGISLTSVSSWPESVGVEVLFGHQRTARPVLLAVFEVHVSRVASSPHRWRPDFGRGVPITLRLLVILSLKPLITANLVSCQLPFSIVLEWTLWTLVIIWSSLQFTLHPVLVVHMEENLLGYLGLELTKVTSVHEVSHVRRLHMVL